MKLALLAIAACSSGVPAVAPPAQPTTPTTLNRAFGIPGETIEYRVTLRGVGVGRVVVTVGQRGFIDGRPAVIVRSRAHSDGLLAIVSELTYEITTTIDLARARPIRTIEDTRLVLAGKVEHGREEQQWTAGDRTHDLHSAAAVIRGWQSVPDERAGLAVVIDRLYLQVALWHAAREVIDAPRTLAAVRYEGIVADKYRFAVWVSDDLARVPLRLRTQSKWGVIGVELVDYESPPE